MFYSKMKDLRGMIIMLSLTGLLSGCMPTDGDAQVESQQAIIDQLEEQIVLLEEELQTTQEELASLKSDYEQVLSELSSGGAESTGNESGDLESVAASVLAEQYLGEPFKVELAFQFIGMKTDELIEILGDGYEVIPEGIEGSFRGLRYEDLGVTFGVIATVENPMVHTIFLAESGSILGTTLNMSSSEIIGALGEGTWYDLMTEGPEWWLVYEQEGYVLEYRFIDIEQPIDIMIRKESYAVMREEGKVAMAARRFDDLFQMFVNGEIEEANEFLYVKIDPAEIDVTQRLLTEYLTMLQESSGAWRTVVSDVDDTYFYEDEQGNSVKFHYRDGFREGFDTILRSTAQIDAMITDFQQGLISEDEDLLVRIMTEDDLYAKTDDARMVIDLYKAAYDLETIEISFLGIDRSGFKYRLSGVKEGQEYEEILHVNRDDGIIHIIGYRGCEVWKAGN